MISAGASSSSSLESGRRADGRQGAPLSAAANQSRLWIARHKRRHCLQTRLGREGAIWGGGYLGDDGSCEGERDRLALWGGRSSRRQEGSEARGRVQMHLQLLRFAPQPNAKPSHHPGKLTPSHRTPHPSIASHRRQHARARPDGGACREKNEVGVSKNANFLETLLPSRARPRRCGAPPIRPARACAG